jgi:hypothetical protein
VSTVVDRRGAHKGKSGNHRLERGVPDALCRKADRIFTTLQGSHDPHLRRFERLKDEQGRDSDRDSNSLWLRHDHDRLTEKSVALALKLK